MKFTKMQGTGNDYVCINGFTEKINHPAEPAARIGDRHFGVGSDGLVLIRPSKACDFSMRLFNPDGSEAEMYGNAAYTISVNTYTTKG